MSRGAALDEPSWVVSVTKEPAQNGVWTGFKGKVVRDVAYCRAMAMRTASSGETR
jgi:hypothetical protein